MAHVEERPERFVINREGQKVGVLLSMEEYSELLEELEELESIRAYDAAKASGEKPVPFEAAVEEIEGRRRTG
jgi:PHD/YefM family antitoxin component YafN of YafNO toxin-antitoxin module